MDLLIGVLGAGVGSGVMAILLAVLQRKWKKEDQTDDQQSAIMEKLDHLNGRMDKMEAEAEQREIKHARIRILRFRDECSHDVKHSEEHFDQVIEDIDDYEAYCTDHPEFKNNKAVTSIQIIKDTYRRRLVNNDFI